MPAKNIFIFFASVFRLSGSIKEPFVALALGLHASLPGDRIKMDCRSEESMNMIFRFRKGIFLAGFACCEMKTLTLLTLFCPSLLHFTTILYCQNVLANVPSRQSGFRHRHRRLAKPPSPAQPFHPSPSPSLQPIPSRSFNKARDRPVGRLVGRLGIYFGGQTPRVRAGARSRPPPSSRLHNSVEHGNQIDHILFA